MSELSKTYDPQEVERGVAALWEAGAYFHAEPDERPPEERYCIVIPPPNVTGALHLGHALNNTLQDVLVRWHRMQGHNVLWLPGTDHAGIATQAVVEKRLKEEEGLSRHDIGRQALVERIWQWKDQYEARIISQLKLMGCSCDFTRTRFTLDEGCSRAVRETFFKLFEEGLIYRGKRLVNWDCELQTAVADDEVYHETVQGKFYHFRYPLKEPQGDCDEVIIATTRPETMLGDTAVAVNPNDARYRNLIGQTIILPLMNREIPIIADDWADPELGSGCVKITPAHDPNDYEVGLKHDLPMVNILNPDGTINENGNGTDGRYKYAGVDRFAARQRVLEDMQALGLVLKIEEHEHDVGHSDRSKTPIEPYLSDQWFVKMDTALSERTLDAVRSGEVAFCPERYRHAYLDWLGEKRDWCISRQLWWGHRIPVWSRRVRWGAFDKRELEPLAGAERQDSACTQITRLSDGRTVIAGQFDALKGQEFETADECEIHVCLRHEDGALAEQLQALGFERADDVLDTWFSSALWPHSTLGWPDDTKELAYYYPTSVLITARDIISLWVVRMVLTGLYNMNHRPFDEVYINPKILDGFGETMSKSKGNGVDPIDIIEAYGADALRFGLAAATTETQDIRMPVEYLCPHCAKLTPQTRQNRWRNEATRQPSRELACAHCKQEFATRWAGDEKQQELGLALMVSDKFEAARNFMNKLWNAARFAFINLDGADPQELALEHLPTEDRWILAELSRVIRTVHTALARYHYSRATLALRNFFWDALCDWYLEMIKFRINENHQPEPARQILALCLDQILRLMHPVIPFVTEGLWQQLNTLAPRRGLPGVVGVGLVYPLCSAQPADESDTLTIARYPPGQGYAALDDPEICETFQDLQDAARAVREVRSTAGLSPKDAVGVTIKTAPDRVRQMQAHTHVLRQMAGIRELVLDAAAQRRGGSAVKIVGHLQIYVHDTVDDTQERQRVKKQVAVLSKRIQVLEGKLANQGYLRSAPPEVVSQTRLLLEQTLQERETFEDVLKLLLADA